MRNPWNEMRNPWLPERFFLNTRHFTVLILAALAPVAVAEEISIPLDVNFNGMVHPGEAGQPDAVDGFRSISDRALSLDGSVDAFGDLTSATSGLSYDAVDLAGVLDIIHVGNRNTVDGGNWAFDAAPDGDDIGIQPDWLPDADQTTAVQAIDPGIRLDGTSRIGIVYQISNGGGDFDVTLGFEDSSSVTVTLNGPDWFGPFAGTPDPAGPGVSVQENLGVDFTGAENVDQGNPGATLIVTEAVIDAAELLANLGFDVDGLTLTSLTFDNPSNAIAGHAILALTAEGTVPTIVEVPTTDAAGLLGFGALLAIVGAWLLWRRSR